MKKTVYIIVLMLLMIGLFACDEKEVTIVEKGVVEENKEEKVEKEVVEEKKSADLKIEESIHFLADYGEEVEALLEKANNGDDRAMNLLSYYYFNGMMVEKDLDKSLEWSLKAAEKNNVSAMFNAGYNYYVKKEYENAFKWYQKSAEKMFPKALNALSFLYYKGLGIEQDIKKAVDYTFLSAGFLHRYSIENMISLMENKDVEGDVNYWYRILCRNYRKENEYHNTFYEKLKTSKNIMNIEYQLKEVDIPKELIEDILYHYYSGTLYSYFRESSKAYQEFSLEDIKVLDDDIITEIKYKRWYDEHYLVDLNKDGIKELVNFRLQGTIGTSEFNVCSLEEGVYTIDEKSSMELSHGMNGLIEYQGKKYFILAEVDIGNHMIYKVKIFNVDEKGLSNSIMIKLKEEDVHFLKTYQVDESYDELNKMVEERIHAIFSYKYGEDLLYHKVDEDISFDMDLNNDGKKEDYEYISYFWGTINHPISLEVQIDSENILSSILEFNDVSTPLGIEVFSLDGVNYISLLSYEIGTSNYSFTTCKVENNEKTVILNHLITFDEKFIIERNEDE